MTHYRDAYQLKWTVDRGLSVNAPFTVARGGKVFTTLTQYVEYLHTEYALTFDTLQGRK